MNEKNKKNYMISALLFIGFAVWTILVKTIDVQAIGTNGSDVGFAALNKAFHGFTGENLWMYTLTDWTSLLPAAFICGFGLLGLVQMIRRRSFLKVDSDILALGGFYIIVPAFYFLFENVVINYRPVLIEGVMEASYPSSTTVLVITVIPTAVMQFHNRIKNKTARNIINFVLIVYTALMLLARTISGVHWLSDIIGGMLLSTSLVLMYYAVCNTLKKVEQK